MQSCTPIGSNLLYRQWFLLLESWKMVNSGSKRMMSGPFVTPKCCLFYWPCHHWSSEHWCKCNTTDIVYLWTVLRSRFRESWWHDVTLIDETHNILSTLSSTIRVPQYHQLGENVDCINASMRENIIWPDDFDLFAKWMSCTEPEKDGSQCFIREMKRWCEGKSRWHRTWTGREKQGAKRGHRKVLMCSTV